MILIQAVMWSEIDSEFIDQTWPECYLNDDTCRYNGQYSFPSDTPHAGRFVYGAIDLYRAGIVFDENDIRRLLRTFKNVIWNRDVINPKYYDFIDGRLEPEEGPYDSWVMGSNHAPGWTLLAGFDPELQMIFENGDVSTSTNDLRTKSTAFYAALAHNKLVGACQYNNNAIEIDNNIDDDCDGHIDENIIQNTPPPEPPPPTPTCTDNIQNGNETGIDCGGSCNSCSNGGGNNNGGGGGGHNSPPPEEEEPEIACGNSIQEQGETCDDGNIINNDGCSYLCQTEENNATSTTSQIDIHKLQGRILKTVDDPRVYYVNQDNDRYYIPNYNTFASWFKNFNSLIIVTPQTLASYPYQGRLTVKPGNLVKFQNSNKIYAVEPTKTLRWISTGQIFIDFGYDFNKVIHLPEEDFQYYIQEEDIVSSTVHPTGQLLKHGSYAPVFCIKDEATFLSLGFKWQDIITIPVRYWYTRILDNLSFKLKDR